MMSIARARTSSIACGVACLLIIATSAAGVTHAVDHAGGGDYLTIQEGITAAGPGDTVLVAPGTYTGAMNRALDFAGKDLALISESGPQSTVIDCEGESRGVLFQSGEGPSALFAGFTVTNGSEFFGGAVYCVASSPTITDCVFRDNTAAQTGGAMLVVASSSPSVVDCVFERNSAHDATGAGGGAVYCEQFSAPVFTSCRFEENTADLNGGAVCVFFASPSFDDCMFAGNSAPNLGGAVMAGGNASPTLATCTFVENYAFDGAVMFASQSPGSVLNCVMSLNEGGGTVTCADCAPVITHCCVFENAGGDSLCGDHNDNLFVDPLFCHPEIGDYGLHDDSPCLPGHNAWGEQIGATGPGSCGTGVPGGDDDAWDALMLHPPFPNPSHGTTTLSCLLPPGASDLEVSIYDAAGRCVRTLTDRGSGRNRNAFWDGRDREGRRVAAGTYFVRAVSGALAADGKLLIVR
jgi:hypothetical protein